MILQNSIKIKNKCFFKIKNKAKIMRNTQVIVFTLLFFKTISIFSASQSSPNTTFVRLVRLVRLVPLAIIPLSPSQAANATNQLGNLATECITCRKKEEEFSKKVLGLDAQLILMQAENERLKREYETLRATTAALAQENRRLQNSIGMLTQENNGLPQQPRTFSEFHQQPPVIEITPKQ